MDDRNGNIYPNKQSALDSGVPEAHIHEVKTITSGPFKGRQYLLNKDGSLGKRVDNIKKKELVNA